MQPFMKMQVVLIVVAAILGVVVAIIVFYLWLRYRKKSLKGAEGSQSEIEPLRKKSTIVPHQRISVVNAPPTIQVNTVEFTLPAHQSSRPYSGWGEGLESCHENVHDDSGSSNDESEHHKDETGVQTRVGLLRPELYITQDDSDCEAEEELPLGNIGRVWFRLEYDCDHERLLVTLHRIQNLPGRQQRTSISLSSRSSCDPFVRIYLLPDEKRYLQSKMKRKTRNPNFKETFMFTMSYAMLMKRTLRISVFDMDRFMRQVTIGHVLYPLENLDIREGVEEWRDVEKSGQISNKSGRLQIGLTFFPGISRVAVNVIKALNVYHEDEALPDTYVKVTYSLMSKVQKAKKTPLHRENAAPEFNQTYEFKIERSNTDVATIKFDIFHSTSGVVKNDKLLGSLVLGGSMCTRGKELEHWTEMMANPQTLVKRWHDLKI